MPTMREVARAAGVSPSTVSQVINGNLGFCSAETAERVRRAVRELGYQPSAIARALARGRTHNLAVLGEYPDDLHAAPMLKAVHELSRRSGYHVSLFPPADHLEEQFADRRFDVVLLARDVSQADALAASVAGTPQIVLAAGSVSSAPPSRVLAACWSDRQGTQLLAEHLAALGHRRIAFLLAQQSPSGKGEFFVSAARELGLETTVLRCDKVGEDMALGAALAREALQLHPRPTALVGRTDAVALGALHALREAGLRVPEDISVAGYYDFAFSPYLSPSLTTVYTPFQECAVAVLAEALAALGRQPFAPPPPRLINLPVELRVRGSTGPAPA
jgi:LacI family transcriptional regulator